MRRYGVTGVLAACAGVAVGTSSCKSRLNNESRAKQDTAAAGRVDRLDANDVSLLLPLPETPEAIDRLLPLSASTGKGTLVPKALFASVLSKLEYETELSYSDDPKDAVKEKLDSGIVMTGKRRKERAEGLRVKRAPTAPEGADFDFARFENWRVVAARFDACSPTPRHSHNAALRKASGNDEAGWKPPTEYDPAKCQAQIRLTAQPVIPNAYDPTSFSPTNPDRAKKDPAVKVADYAMHLIYDLDEARARSIVADLLALKRKCGGVTDGLPLGRHPCFVHHALGRSAGFDPNADFRALVSTYATDISRIAMMGTDLSLDPWVFLHGRVEGESFVHEHIDAVRRKYKSEELPRSTVTGRVLRLPFGNGFYQMFTLLMANGTKESKGGMTPSGENVDGKQEAVVPRAVQGAVNDEISAYVKPNFEDALVVDGQPGNAKFEEAVVRARDAIHAIQKVENPMLNDASSTDCVSCHTTSLPLGVIRGTLQKKYGGSNVTEYHKDDPERFKAPRGVTASVSPDARPNDKYNVINFGYFLAKASVSRRTAHESALSADISNRSLLPSGSAPEPIDRCEQPRLQACLEENEKALEGKTSLQLAHASRSAVTACFQRVCPDKRGEVEKYLPPVSYVANKATTIVKSLDDKFPMEGRTFCQAPAGTVISVASGEDVAGKPGFMRVLFERQTSNPTNCMGVTFAGEYGFVTRADFSEASR